MIIILSVSSLEEWLLQVDIEELEAMNLKKAIKVKLDFDEIAELLIKVMENNEDELQIKKIIYFLNTIYFLNIQKYILSFYIGSSLQKNLTRDYMMGETLDNCDICEYYFPEGFYNDIVKVEMEKALKLNTWLNQNVKVIRRDK